MKPEQILQGYVSLLVTGGEKQATLDAVARTVGLSKAGLLHHFRSRAALNEGLIAYLRTLIDADLTEMRNAPQGAAHYYLASSFEADSPLEQAVVAVTRLWQGGNEAAGQLLRNARDQWFELLVADIGDPVIARFVMLAGDGVSYHMDIAQPASSPAASASGITSASVSASVATPTERSPAEVSADDIERLAAVVARLSEITPSDN